MWCFIYRTNKHSGFFVLSDTIPGRLCMASCFFLLRQFKDVLIYLNSVKVSAESVCSVKGRRCSILSISYVLIEKCREDLQPAAPEFTSAALLFYCQQKNLKGMFLSLFSRITSLMTTRSSSTVLRLKLLLGSTKKQKRCFGVNRQTGFVSSLFFVLNFSVLLQIFLSIQSEKIKNDFIYVSWLARCCMYGGDKHNTIKLEHKKQLLQWDLFQWFMLRAQSREKNKEIIRKFQILKEKSCGVIKKSGKSQNLTRQML